MSAENNDLDKEITDLLKTNPAFVDLSNRGITGEHVKMIVEHQKQNPTIIALRLDGNNIGVDGYNALAELVRGSRLLTILSADNNFLLDDKKRIKYYNEVGESSDAAKKAARNLEKALLENPNIRIAKIDGEEVINKFMKYFVLSGKLKYLQQYGDVPEIVAKHENNKIIAQKYVEEIKAYKDFSVEDLLKIKSRIAIIFFVAMEQGEKGKISQEFLGGFDAVMKKSKEKGVVMGKGIIAPYFINDTMQSAVPQKIEPKKEISG